MKKFLSLMLAVSLIMTFAGSMLASAATITLGKKGDANEDGKISIVDVVLMRAHIVGSATLEGNKFILADINEDGKVNIVDVVMARSAIVTQADLGDKTTEEEVNNEAEEMSKKYNMTKEELIKAIGGLDMLKYDMTMRKAVNIIKGE